MMRLINTSTYIITEFYPPNIPVYAILSHTWEEDEYIFADRHVPHRQSSAGFRKISACCTLAASEGWQYLWVDTCCIDKSSSAELTEAINSMYKWYEKSEVCYVYLADYSLDSTVENLAVAFGDSRWFKRGWTLQELLAPKNVVFYDRGWMEIGTRSYLESCLIELCHIESHFFMHPRSASVAMKMSWVSRRQTSREEDMAYCLLGLFDINMSLIYGEGQNAFFRLQCEIIQRTPDESIFAWEDHEVKNSGLLARNPSAFAQSGDIIPISLTGKARPPWRMTNMGLELGLDVELHNHSSGHTQTSLTRYTTFLACARGSYSHIPVVLRLRLEGEEFAVRENCNQLLFDTTGLMYRMASLERRILYFQNQHTILYIPLPPSRLRVEFKVLLTQAARSYLRINAHMSCSKDDMRTVNDSSITLHLWASGVWGSYEIILDYIEQPMRTIKIAWDKSSGPWMNVFDCQANHPPEFKGGVRLYDNLSWSYQDGKFIWFKTKLEIDALHGNLGSRWVVIVDITSIDRSKLATSIDG